MIKRRAYIGLGANQGEPDATLAAAVESLKSVERTELVAVSPFYRSAPIDASGPDFLNAVVAVDTELEPYGLLLHLHDIEMVLGRKRRASGQKNAPRKVDLDLLMVGSLIMRSTPLTLPHPRLHERRFVLRPLLDLDSDATIPGLGPAAAFLERTADQRVEPVSSATPAA